jgi:hypothetical protein
MKRVTLQSLDRKLDQILRAICTQGAKEMSAIDSFKEQFTRLQKDFAAQIKAFSDKLANHDDPAVAQASLDMSALADQVEQSIASITPAEPPAPPA